MPVLLDLLEAEDAYVRLRASEILGNWGPQAEALPALLGLLEADSADVRLRASEVLGNWGHQAEALPALLGFLEAEDAAVRLGAAEVLGNWNGNREVVSAVLDEVNINNKNELFRFFVSDYDEDVHMYSCEISLSLKEILISNPVDDGVLDTALKEVIFKWIWKVYQGS